MLGYGLVYGTLKFPNFAHGSVAMVGAYAAYFLTVKPLQLPFLLAVPIAVAVFVAAVGVLTEYIAYRPFRGRARLAPLVTTIAAALMIQSVVMLLTGSRILNYGFPVSRRYCHRGSLWSPEPQIITLVASFVLMFLVYLMLKLTKLGKSMPRRR